MADTELSPPKLNEKSTPNKLRKPKPKVLKARLKESRGGTTFADKVFFFLLFAYGLYAAILCPQHAHDTDISQTPATCRALASYRSHILEPYLLPPLKSAYHSEFVRPYTEKLEEVAWKVEESVKPWYQQAFLPRWREHVVPRYHSLAEVLEPGYQQALGVVSAQLEPYLAQVEPHYTKFLHDFHLYRTQAEKLSKPYIAQGHKVYTQVRPYLDQAEEVGTKAFWDAWRVAKPHVIVALRHAQVYAKIGLKQLIEARRTYVDPHIKRILEQVDGNGKSSSVVVEARATESTEAAKDEPTPVNVEETEVIPTTVIEEPYGSTTEDSAPAATPLEAVDEVLEDSTPEATSSPAHTAVEAAPTPAQEPIIDEPSVAKSSSGSLFGANAQKTPDAEPDLELDDFLSELGLEPENPSNAAPPQPEAVPEEEEEQPIPIPEDPVKNAEIRKAAIKAKRDAIVARHVEWQKKLDELFDEQERRVYVEVEGVREWAVSELGDEFAMKVVDPLEKLPNIPETRYKRSTIARGQGLGGKALDGLNKQGARFIRGLETYLASLESRVSSWTSKSKEEVKALREKESDKWEGVVDKVEEKFDKLVVDVQGEIHTWYTGIRERELEVVTEAGQAIRNLAERAQADVAMDYAWLEDVAIKDWANYHELMTTFEDFQKTAQAIQNGSYVPAGIFVLHPLKPTPSPSSTPTELTADRDEEEEADAPLPITPPADPLVGALNNLQSEWNDLVSGFKLSISSNRRRASEILAAGRTSEEEEEGTFRIKNEKGKRVDDMREYLEEAKGRLEGGLKDAAQVVIGKDPVVVAENVKKATVEHGEL